MNDEAVLPRLYWHQKEHPSFGVPSVQYVVLWLFPTGRFCYIGCWPGYSWFMASGEWHEQDGKLLCQGHSRGWSDTLADNHDDRVYTEFYTVNEDEERLMPGTTYKAPLTRIRPSTVESLFGGVNESDLPCHWRDFSDLMRQIERHLGIIRKASRTFLHRDSA